MAFTFNTDLSTDVDLVRFHIGDTDKDGYYLEDETIQYWVTKEGSVGGAVLKCLSYIITQLSVPNFRLDWMRVDTQEARVGYENLFREKQQEFGITVGLLPDCVIEQPTRADSYQASNDYSESV